MVDYLYDGSFDGLLCCIHSHYYEEHAAGIFLKADYQPSMLNASRDVAADEAKAARVYEAIEQKISYMDIGRVYRIFLSNAADKEMTILRYVTLGF